MVYAPYGRTGIYMLQEFCRRVGIRATDKGNRGSHLGAAGVASGPSVGNCAARGAGFSAGGGAGRCAAAPTGPRLLCASIIRFYPAGRTDIWPVDKTSALLPSMWRDGASPSSLGDGRALPSRAVRRCGAFSRNDGSPQRHRLSGRSSHLLPANQFCGRRMAKLCAYTACQRPSVFKTGCLRARLD